jgi:hypothetical protein
MAETRSILVYRVAELGSKHGGAWFMPRETRNKRPVPGPFSCGWEWAVDASTLGPKYNFH